MKEQELRWKRAEEVLAAYSDGFITDNECGEMMSLYLNDLSTVKEEEVDTRNEEEVDTYNWDTDSPAEYNFMDDLYEQEYE
tara:strand:- start:463 stop:705 length:243 start_codon:yes stop_codon:yes gene_type:complete